MEKDQWLPGPRGVGRMNNWGTKDFRVVWCCSDGYCHSTFVQTHRMYNSKIRIVT